ncbi:MAG: heat-shock protein Hsp15 [Bacteroidetes bacterium GWF2_33_16]|nr:MAG: heat-shock protein Hsp15 [Bacteroidetes bacterium GWE2_32_14]OFY08851.1 MAG: heat-shock protein Hsp15 [Bacteroidetes bacterium GWF2_33_16]
MEKDHEIRIDKWLWAVRIFKTRSQASEACRKGRIIINDVQVKPSRVIKVGEIVIVRKPPVNHQFKIIGLLENRQSAKLVVNYVEDLTSDEEKAIIEIKNHIGFEIRDRGIGRPTKKERRLIDELKKIQ